jgi:hypothetical protein|nr:MAG TPA: large terminase [Caudoviricetes sp.]
MATTVNTTYDETTFVQSLNKEEKYAWDNLDEIQKEGYKRFNPDHWLADPKHWLHYLMWVTFYRRNLDIFAEHYLGLKLYLYQKIILFLMSHCTLIVIIAARAAAKSYIIAIYSTCICILYPKSAGVLVSGTKGQASLIISEKINKEMYMQYTDSPLRVEITKIKPAKDDAEVQFINDSSIKGVTLSEDSRGNRSTFNIIEEARNCKKNLIDNIVSPFKINRKPEFTKTEFYEPIAELFQEEAQEIYISSSIEETHWLYKLATSVKNDMDNDDEDSLFLAMDYAISLQHGIRSKKQLIQEKQKIGNISWMIEYENRVFRANTDAFFSYDIIKSNRTMLKPFYPQKNEDFLLHKKNPYSIPKQKGEVRVISCDIATVDRSANDNSVYSCLRLFPEQTGYNNRTEYRIQVPYLEGMKGTEPVIQATRIRQLYNDFEADYIVLDLRNCGIDIYYTLARPLFDEGRCVEYAPLRCMNDDELADKIKNENADDCIYVVKATEKLNTRMAQNLQSYLTSHKIDFLVDKERGMETICKLQPSYPMLQPTEQVYFDKPFLETMLLVNEMIDLTYERTSVGNIRVKERAGKVKDRYSSLTMGCYFANEMALDKISEETQMQILDAPSCVSAFSW